MHELNHRQLPSRPHGNAVTAPIVASCRVSKRTIRKIGVALPILALAACGGSEIEPVAQYVGAIVADEPRAVDVAREILLQGGSAADAAAGLYFAMSVTFPAQASLAAGGGCLVFDPTVGKAISLGFYGQSGSGVPASGGRPTSIPTAVRGFYALQARFGRLRWAQVVAPAEALARFETPLSRAMARELDVNGPFVYADEQSRRVFGSQGRPAVEGDPIAQPALAQVLTEIRTKGPAEFYTGDLSRRFVNAVRAAGGTITAEDMASVRVSWKDAPSVLFGRRDLFLAADPAVGSLTAGVLSNLLIENDAYDDADDNVKHHVLAEASMIAFADRATWFAQSETGAGGRLTSPVGEILDEDRAEDLWELYTPTRHLARGDFPTRIPEVLENQAGTGFSVVDPSGLGVTCMVTLNNPFGIGRIAPQTGIMLGADPNVTRGGPTPLAYAIIGDVDTGKYHGGITASGGVLAATAMIRPLIGIEVDEQPLALALDQTRVHNTGNPDITFHERRLPDLAVDQLKALGHETAVLPPEVQGSPPKVNALFCDNGFPGAAGRCEALPDPRGSGLSFGHVTPQ